MIFKTLEKAGKFYKHYSKLAGFSTKIRNTAPDGDKIKNKLIVCSREGRWKSKRSPTLKTNPSAGLNYPDRIYIHIMKDVGLWTISKVVLNHSHPCCLDQAKMLKQHRELSMFVRHTSETHEEARIRLSKTYQSFVAAVGSHRELGFIEKDARNYITRAVRNISEEDDAKEFGKYLVRMKEKNQNFFFELNLEDDHCIKHVFWANARNMAAFDYFGDVISFDTTYNTSRYNLVLGSFVGVNHHGQSTLLGCALMKNEDIQSFKWLFECWLRCMGGKAPKGILTDQCTSIQRVIELYMPTTIHRWCIWHIMKKIPSKLNGYKGHNEIEQEMSHIVWNSYTKEAFGRNWIDFIGKYGLRGNKWLSGN
ncbi:protein FAR1-RELATED SEQUENCE 4-like [Arachis duranensis]|uniref:Protein FAR1-RELATED SEQUENCE 4-like n=1 Tax=Arachis duranensis TaxID=130453 RepID=A0A6P4CU51_ARADU|nr:protein FAR1-RELATED SEQUENCE 4-like [Arachis duranensis]